MDTVSWLSYTLLGVFHGINPGMGWLFAVALGMQGKTEKRGYWCPFSDGTWTRYIHRSRGFRHRLGAATTPGRSPSYRVCSYIVRFWCVQVFPSATSEVGRDAG